MNVDDPRPVRFREVQRLPQWWLWVLVLLVAALGWWAFVEQIVFGRPWGSKPAPDWVVWLVWAFSGLVLPIGLLLARLLVEVRDDEILVSFRPLRTRRIDPKTIQSVDVSTFRPIRDWGGWGIRWRPGKGWAYLAHGNQAVGLTFDEGKPFTIGSQEPEALAEAIRRLLP